MNLKKMFLWILLVPILIMLELRFLVWFDNEIVLSVLGYYRIGFISIVFILSLLGLVFLVIITRLVAWCLRRKKKYSQSSGSIYQNDIPIDNIKDDIFNRKPVVVQIADLIINGPSGDCALYVALYGDWGSGKTSICKLVQEYLNDSSHNAIFVNFSPWRYSKDCDLQSIFFKILADKLAQESKLSFVASACKDFSFHLECKNFHRKVGSVQWLFDIVRTCLFDSTNSFEKLEGEFKKLLVNSKRRIIVIIDDIERLPSDQVCDVVRFIKANGDLPGVVYLVLSDEEYLASAVGKMLPSIKKALSENGREYLEKIFQFKFYVPGIDKQQLLDLVKRLIKKELERRGIGDKKSELDADEEILSYVDTMRKAKCVVNRFIQDLGVAKNVCSDKVYINKHIGDMVALGILQQKLPHVFNKLQEIYEYCVGSRENIELIIENNGVVREEKIRELIPGLAQQDWDSVTRFLMSRFDIKKDYEKNVYSINNCLDPAKALNFRLSSGYVYKSYFRIEEPMVPISEDEINEFEKVLKNETNLKVLIGQLIDSNKLASLLYVYAGHDLYEDEQDEAAYFYAIIFISTIEFSDISNFNNDKNFSDVRETMYDRLYNCLSHYILKILNDRSQYGKIGKDRIARCLLPSLRTIPDNVYILSKLIAHDSLYSNRHDRIYDNAFFDYENFTEIKNLFLEKIKDFVAKGKLTNHVEFFDIFRCWMFLLKENKKDVFLEEFKSACVGLLKNSVFVVQMLRFFCNDNRNDANLSDELEVTVKIDKLEKYFGVGASEVILQTIENASKINLYNFHALLSLQYAINQRSQNMDYSIDEQKRHLLSYCKTEDYREARKVKVDESLCY